MAREAKSIEDALEELRRNRAQPVLVRAVGLTVELRAVDTAPVGRSAWDVFEEIGAWAGDDADEVADAIARSRGRSGSRSVVGL